MTAILKNGRLLSVDDHIGTNDSSKHTYNDNDEFKENIDLSDDIYFNLLIVKANLISNFHHYGRRQGKKMGNQHNERPSRNVK